MDYNIFIKVDTNDADYITEVSKISEEDLEKIKPLIEAIKNFEPYQGPDFPDGRKGWWHNHNFPAFDVREDLGEKTIRELYPQFSEEVHEIFYDLCPSLEEGFHSIEEILIAPYTEKIRLL